MRPTATRTLWMLSALLAACARPGPSVPPAPEPEQEEHEGWLCGFHHNNSRHEVWLGALGGPHATADVVCDELAGWAKRAGGWITTPCTRAPVPLPAGALASAWILRIGVGKQGRIRDLAAYFLAIERQGAWYLEPSPLEVASAGPSRRHPISVTPLQGELEESERGRKLGVLRLRAELPPSWCDECVRRGAQPARAKVVATQKHP